MYIILFILAILFSIVTIFVMKDIRITIRDCCGIRVVRMKCREIGILCLSYFIPFIGIIMFIAFNIWFLALNNENRIELNSKNLFHRIFISLYGLWVRRIN